MGLQQCYKKPPLCGIRILDVSADVLDQHMQDAHRQVIPTISLFWGENGSLLLIKRHVFRRFAHSLVVVHYKAIIVNLLSTWTLFLNARRHLSLHTDSLSSRSQA